MLVMGKVSAVREIPVSVRPSAPVIDADDASPLLVAAEQLKTDGEPVRLVFGDDEMYANPLVVRYRELVVDGLIRLREHLSIIEVAKDNSTDVSIAWVLTIPPLLARFDASPFRDREDFGRAHGVLRVAERVGQPLPVFLGGE